ncbi:hypothetical protein WJX79_007375 [Trebouxia sp. C0005]
MAEQHLTAKIKDIKSNGKPLVVLLKGPGKDSSMMEMILRTSGLATLRDQATLFVLSASEQATSMPPIVAALSKSSLPAIQQADLPMVIVLNGEGKALSVARGLVTAGELQQSLADAVASFHPQGGSLPPGSPHPGSAAAPAPNAEGEEEAASSNPTPTPAPSESRQAQSTEESALTAAAPSSSAASMTETPKVAAHQPQPPDTTTVPAGVAVVPKEPLVHSSQTVQLQIHLPDGQAVRGSFKGANTLQEVCHFVDQQSQATRSRDCQIVCLHPPKEFSVSDLARSLAELGVQSQTSLRLRHTQASAGSRGVESDPDSNKYWNGNSTQFDGNDQ